MLNTFIIGQFAKFVKLVGNNNGIFDSHCKKRQYLQNMDL